TDLPGITFPCVEAEAELAIMRVRLVEVFCKPEVLVRTGCIGAPALLACLDVIGSDVSPYAEFGTRGTDNHHVLDHVGGNRQGCTNGNIGVLHHPAGLAGSSVERRNMAVKLGPEDQGIDFVIARPVGKAAVHDITAGY